MNKPGGDNLKKLKAQRKAKQNDALLPNLPGMAYRCKYDRDWTMLFVSEGCYDLTGYKAEDLVNNKEVPFNEIINPEYREPIWKEWERVIALKETFRYEYEITTAKGEKKWVLETGRGIYGPDGKAELLEGIIIDVTERKERELQLKYLYDHDYLTSLYNRRYFEEILLRDACAAPDKKRAVILINLRKFTYLNITYGYHYSENLVREIVGNLLRLCRDNVRLFHISIDRYAFYVEGFAGKDALVSFCGAVSETLGISPMLKTIGWSIGVYEIRPGDRDPENILKNASLAAANVRASASGYSFFDNELEERLYRKADIVRELTRAAIYDDSGLFLVYQPILDLKRNTVYGFEALARLKSETLGEVMPGEFIPIAEESQLIIPIGRIIIRKALDFMERLHAGGYKNAKVSVNISTIQLLEDSFIPSLTEAIGEKSIDPANLCLEITESVFSSDYEEINRRLDEIRRFGIRVALDDFGTGYSTLARERELNVDIMKIDKYFIDKILTIDARQAITSDIISMAHKLGHSVVAEGVENEYQKQYLIENGCDFIQGFLFSKPLPEYKAAELLG